MSSHENYEPKDSSHSTSRTSSTANKVIEDSVALLNRDRSPVESTVSPGPVRELSTEHLVQTRRLHTASGIRRLDGGGGRPRACGPTTVIKVDSSVSVGSRDRIVQFTTESRDRPFRPGHASIDEVPNMPDASPLSDERFSAEMVKRYKSIIPDLNDDDEVPDDVYKTVATVTVTPVRSRSKSTGTAPPPALYTVPPSTYSGRGKKRSSDLSATSWHPECTESVEPPSHGGVPLKPHFTSGWGSIMNGSSSSESKELKVTGHQWKKSVEGGRMAVNLTGSQSDRSTCSRTRDSHVKQHQAHHQGWDTPLYTDPMDSLGERVAVFRDLQQALFAGIRTSTYILNNYDVVTAADARHTALRETKSCLELLNLVHDSWRVTTNPAGCTRTHPPPHRHTPPHR